MSFGKGSDIALFFRVVSEEAGQRRLRTIPLAGAGVDSLGLVLTRQETAGPDLAGALFRLARAENMAGGAVCRAAINSDTCQVTVEERAQLWRRA